jgi:hypothetical protein
MTDELSIIKNNCYYGKGNEDYSSKKKVMKIIAIDKALLVEIKRKKIKKSKNQGPSSG